MSGSRAESQPAIPLVEELTPAPVAWEAASRLTRLPHLLFLDSAGGPAELTRHSFVLADPFAWLRSHRDRVTLTGAGVTPLSAASGDPLAALAELLDRWRAEALPDLPPLQGGAAGLFGYDLCHHLERLPRPGADEFGVPNLALGLYDRVAAFDHATGRAWLISTGFPETDPARRRERAGRRLAELRTLLAEGAAWEKPPLPGPAVELVQTWPVEGVPGVGSNFDRAGYLATVRRAIDYVHAGDCFQVNLSQRFVSRLDVGGPWGLYRRLRERCPAPFAGYFDLGDFVVASASPERFVRLHGGAVETRPIKGTRPRGVTAEEDAARAEELCRSAKDRAENVMIIDLLRNDLGRVCAYGSVRVESVCRLESYRTVHHLVSEVRGSLRPGLGAVDLLRATFPGGSVTGAPKVRAMEIIAELEPTARGAYCGCLGYVGFDGTADTNLLIRTFTAGRGWVQFPAGGGVVADSDPAGEYAETLAKAEGLFRSLR